MSAPEGLAFEPFVDDGGNIGIRLNQEVVVYTPEEQAQIRAEFERLQADNSKLRELAEKAWKFAEMLCQAWDGPCHADGVSIKPPCPMDERDELCVYGCIQRDLRELGVEVD